ncbi:hypothetical protein EHQ76_09145 [Leptospira barantonii]|uniref:Uncharacterized protein n=1 Tax=Leptospira barantonii TaxID=2023184 RepID=A0A5F2BEI5_9LEPT|nr:hypothetical protein [Leptospira barantonii]TGM03797.1 hypothetical protein EHQ76_09145 [Leptospira barantonii]
MGHFCVFVIGENIEEQIEPFLEDIDSDSPYYKFNIVYTKDQGLKEAKNILENSSVGNELKEKFVHWFQEGKIELILNEHDELIQDTDGNFGYYGNANGHFTYYKIGGSWNGIFELKPGAIDLIDYDNYKIKSDARYDVRPVEGFANRAIKKDIFVRDLLDIRPLAIIWDKVYYETGSWYEVSLEELNIDIEKNRKIIDERTAHIEKFIELWNKIPDDAVLTIVDGKL